MFLGNVGPTEVQGNWLSTDNPAQHERGDGSAAVQIDGCPKSLVTTPIHQKERFVSHFMSSCYTVKAEQSKKKVNMLL